MNDKVLIMAAVILLFAETTNAQASFEQYFYLEKNKHLAWVPIIRYTTSKNWYGEARYNYEEMNTFSLYAGKVFSHKGRALYSVTPIVGAVFGNFTGGSTGLNLSLDYRRFFFSSQSQYTFSRNTESLDFFFSWAEAAYQPAHWIYFGLSAQHTYYNEIKTGMFEPGVVVGFEAGKWTFPFYAFGVTTAKKYFVLGINFDLCRKDIAK